MPDTWLLVGGADRDRTDDLMLAKHALSQLIYGPIRAAGSQKSENRNRKSEASLQVFWFPASDF